MRRNTFNCSLLVFCVTLFASQSAYPAAQETTPNITRVVESWAFQVRNPGHDHALPQITCVISPDCNLDGHHAVLELNSWTVPSFAEGGVQLQLWNGNSSVKQVVHPSYGKLHHAGETVTFDISMTLNGDQIEFEVLNGVSSSWGNFGGTGNMKVAVQTALGDLNCYDPNFTITNTAISRGVQNLEQMQFRGYVKYSGDQVVEENQVPVDKHNFLQVVK